MRYKFNDLKPILIDRLCDILVISETKLDDSFNNNLFTVNGYKLERKDRNANGGGIMVFFRADLPVRRINNLECEQSETIFLELKLNNRTWGILCSYRPPSTNDSLFEKDLCSILDQSFIKYDHLCVIGDLNYDFLSPEKCKPIMNICDSFNFTNLIKEPTCFTKNGSPSLIDVILTNNSNLLFHNINFNCGLSDWHNMIATVFKENSISNKRQKVTFRSYKNFCEAGFVQDLQRAPLHIAGIFDDIDDSYWAYETLVREIVDEHAPQKQKYPKKESPPFMNSELRRAIYKKKMLFNKHKKYKGKTNWENYRKQRNYVTKLRKQSIKLYFFERCSGGPKSKDFWPTIKPFLSSKTSKNSADIILIENNSLVSDQAEVCNILNDFYINIAKEIGINNQTSDTATNTHPSIQAIKDNSPIEGFENFDFKPVSESQVLKIINSLSSKKATGVDQIPPKILKAGAEVLSGPVSSIFNKGVSQNQFPNRLKVAQVSPIFKKDDPFIKKNYRPVSVLTTHSKIFERIMFDQLSDHFSNIFNTYLAAFRKGFGCQTTLLRLLEDWKRELDNHRYVGAILMDLSKAFDCLPHGLIIDKLAAYGLSDSACSLLQSYLSDRKQMVKLGHCKSTFLKIIKGVPQGSILGPLLFNIFLNDIF